MPEPKPALVTTDSSEMDELAAAEYATESDSLAALEERIRRIVELVNSARSERDRAIKERDAAIAEKHIATRAAEQAQEKLAAELDAALAARDEAVSQFEKAQGVSGEAKKLRDELDHMRGERKQVRTRIEKLLGQMDLLSGQ